jgi:hypothetical protein
LHLEIDWRLKGLEWKVNRGGSKCERREAVRETYREQRTEERGRARRTEMDKKKPPDAGGLKSRRPLEVAWDD